MRQEIKEQLKGTSLARGMTDADVEALLASSQVRLVRYKKGEIIFHEGDVPEKLFLLVSPRRVCKCRHLRPVFCSCRRPLAPFSFGFSPPALRVSVFCACFAVSRPLFKSRRPHFLMLMIKI